MRNYSKIIILMGLIVFIFGTLVGTSLMFPAGTLAHPALGFTPTPIGDRDEEDKPISPTSTPPDYVLVRLEQCDLTCLELYSHLGNPANLLAAAPSADPDFHPLAMLDQANITMEVQVPVQIVHQGSGFIVAQILSDAGSTRIPVPYPGQWQVFITGAPQLVSNLATAFDTSSTNLAELSASLAAGPIPVAMVDANTTEPQMISCPVLCVIAPTPTPEVPPFLPETGQENSLPISTMGPIDSMATIWLTIGAGLLLTGILTMGLVALVILRREVNR
jgi:hypothetical protein